MTSGNHTHYCPICKQDKPCPQITHCSRPQISICYDEHKRLAIEGYLRSNLGGVLMFRPKALDLFCGAGGSTKGLQRAGFYVVGVDIHPQPRYCGDEFIQTDALALSLGYIQGFDIAWAGPPCQKYTMAQNAAKNRDAHPDSIPPTRLLLRMAGIPYVIENVIGAPLLQPFMLCGLAFGLSVKRHRLFETNLPLLVPPCPSHEQDYYVIFGHECRNRRHGEKADRKNRIDVGRAAMGIDWMTRGELSEAIPPAYSEFIGKQALQFLRSTSGVS